MNIQIDPKAVSFLKKHKMNDIHVFVNGCSSWGTGEPQPLVLMGKPKEDEASDYDIVNQDGINIWVRVDTQVGDDGLKIKYSKFLFKESIIVSGIVY